MLRSPVVRLSAAILVAFLSINYGDAFSARESKDRWMKTSEKTDGRSRERQAPENEADKVREIDLRSPSFSLLGVGESVMADTAQNKGDDELIKPEAEYSLKSRHRKKKEKHFLKTDSLLRNADSLPKNADSLVKDLHYILKKVYKRTSMKHKSNRAKYLNSDIIGDKEPLKTEDVVNDEKNEYEEDPDSWTPEKQLEKDYVHVARSTVGFLRQNRRQPASSGSLHAVVDLLVVVDNALYRRALLRSNGDHNIAIANLTKYYRTVVSLVDSRYAQIEDKELSIRVRLAQIFISQYRSNSSWSEQNTRVVKHSLHLDPNVGLEKFHEWLRERHREFDKFDHAMAFTGYSLVTPAGKHTSGMAYIGTMCKVSVGYSCSIIQEDGGLSSVSTAVHELGHSLGAKHDGEGSNSACSASLNYIMAPGSSAKNETLSNFFAFSPCTIREFKELLSMDEVDCLEDSLPDEISSLPGKIFDSDSQCKDVFGQESGYCEVGEVQTPDEICSHLWCVKPGKADSCISRGHLTGVLGTSCAKGKVCKNGRCLDERQVLASLKGSKNSRNQTTVTNRISSAPKQHQPNAVTEKPVKVELGRPKCKEDVFPSYCRRTISKRPDLCQRSDMATNCCFSCSYVSRR